MAETFEEKINRILRDHQGYTNDGQGGVGALPIGDTSTEKRPIYKRDLRESMLSVEGEIARAKYYADLVANTAAPSIATVNALTRIPSKVEIIAHRGGVDLAVQNSSVALTSCLQWADAVEFDISRSSDGRFYGFHDATVNALTNGTGTFTSLLSSYIDTLQFNQLSGHYLRAYYRIPYVTEILDWAARTGTRIYPEIKNILSLSDVDAIVDLVLAAGVASQTVLQSGTMVNTLRALDRSPHISCGFLVNTTDRASFIASIDTMANYPGRGWVIASFASIDANRDLVQYAIDLGVGVAAWTINNPAYYNILVGSGVKHIMTDNAVSKGGRYA